MADLTIYIGNKNYSSWSLRAWLTLKATGAAFDEVVIPLYQPASRAAILQHSPSARVPALRHGEVLVWESLAVCEYLAESFPDAGLWPRDAAARAAARAVSAEMHAGFAALRQEVPMNLRRSPAARSLGEAAQADIERVAAIWRDCRARFGAGRGAFLFGRFTVADAMFAPVATRFRSYAVALPTDAQAYCDSVMAWPALREWIAAARTEPMTIAAFEV